MADLHLVVAVRTPLVARVDMAAQGLAHDVTLVVGGDGGWLDPFGQ